MGGGGASPSTVENARRLGELIAGMGWVLLNGGRNAGVMEASAKGAREAGGLTVGILPGKDGRNASEFIDIQIRTGANDARNYYNVLSSDVVIACPGQAGTISEIALALKNGKDVILLGFEPGTIFGGLEKTRHLHRVRTPEEAVEKAGELLGTTRS
jgi:uncharacterized protein (TIGR00725 family)